MYYKYLRATSAVNMAIEEYKGLTERINNTVKVITSLLICLGGIVTAVAALFTAYCICMPKNDTIDYVLFVINVITILLTFFIDCKGILPIKIYNGNVARDELTRLADKIDKRKTDKEVIDGYIKRADYDKLIDYAPAKNADGKAWFDDEKGENNVERNVVDKEIEMYRNASDKARKVLKIKRKQLRMSMAFTFTNILVLAISVAVAVSV